MKMTWPKWVGLVVTVSLVTLAIIGAIVGGQRPNASRSPNAAPMVVNTPLAPPWVRAAQRTGPTVVINVETPEPFAGLAVPTFGKRILELSKSYRDGSAAMPDGVDHVLIYFDQKLFDGNGTNPKVETVMRSSFVAKDFLAIPDYNYGNWTVFKAATNTELTRIGQLSGMFDGVCQTEKGQSAGNLCY